MLLANFGYNLSPMLHLLLAVMAEQLCLDWSYKLYKSTLPVSLIKLNLFNRPLEISDPCNLNLWRVT
jgi:hypothetical protein